MPKSPSLHVDFVQSFASMKMFLTLPCTTPLARRKLNPWKRFRIMPSPHPSQTLCAVKLCGCLTFKQLHTQIWATLPEKDPKRMEGLAMFELRPLNAAFSSAFLSSHLCRLMWTSMFLPRISMLTFDGHRMFLSYRLFPCSWVWSGEPPTSESPYQDDLAAPRTMPCLTLCNGEYNAEQPNVFCVRCDATVVISNPRWQNEFFPTLGHTSLPNGDLEPWRRGCDPEAGPVKRHPPRSRPAVLRRPLGGGIPVRVGGRAVAINATDATTAPTTAAANTSQFLSNTSWKRFSWSSSPWWLGPLFTSTKSSSSLPQVTSTTSGQAGQWSSKQNTKERHEKIMEKWNANIMRFDFRFSLRRREYSKAWAKWGTLPNCFMASLRALHQAVHNHVNCSSVAPSREHWNQMGRASNRQQQLHRQLRHWQQLILSTLCFHEAAWTSRVLRLITIQTRGRRKVESWLLLPWMHVQVKTCRLLTP